MGFANPNLFYKNVVVTGLSTYQTILPQPGIYTLAWTNSLPVAAQDGGVSMAVMSISQTPSGGGAVTRIYNGPPGGTGSRVTILANAGDKITSVLTSSAPADQPLNAIRTTYSFVQRGITTNLGSGSLTQDQLAAWG